MAKNKNDLVIPRVGKDKKQTEQNAHKTTLEKLFSSFHKRWLPYAPAILLLGMCKEKCVPLFPIRKTIYKNIHSNTVSIRQKPWISHTIENYGALKINTDTCKRNKSHKHNTLLANKKKANPLWLN